MKYASCMSVPHRVATDLVDPAKSFDHSRIGAVLSGMSLFQFHLPSREAYLSTVPMQFDDRVRAATTLGSFQVSRDQ